jgi:hypothetical protein
MNLGKRAQRCLTWLVVPVILGVASRPDIGLGQVGDVVGVITELKSGRGVVEIRPAPESGWRRLAPLQALRAGDVIRVTEDASTTILLTGDQGTVVVDAMRSPYRVPAIPSEKGKFDKAQQLLMGSLGFLRPAKPDPVARALVTRGEVGPPTILSPRNGPVLPGPLTIEWSGGRSLRYTLRIVGPDGGAVFQRVDLGTTRFEYPSAAPAITPGVRYKLQVSSTAYPVQEAWFEILEPGRARILENDLRDLEGALGPAVSSSTRATVRAGFLASHSLIHDARRMVLLAQRQDPDEPALYVMLGHLYEAVGLTQEAAHAFDAARSLQPSGENITDTGAKQR